MKNREWHKEKIVSIDFDGVLAKYNGYKGENIVGDPIDGAKDFVSKLIESGYKPMIFTVRDIEVVSEWIKNNNFPNIEITNIKRPSLVYIDDRCIKFDGDYSKLIEDLGNFDVYWRDKDYGIFDELFKNKI
jgi:hypothetical protein